MKTQIGEPLPEGYSVINLYHKPQIGSQLVNPEKFTNELEKPELTVLIDTRTGKTRTIKRIGDRYTTDGDNRKYIVKLNTAITTAKRLHRKELRADNGTQQDLFNQVETRQRIAYNEKNAKQTSLIF